MQQGTWVVIKKWEDIEKNMKIVVHDSLTLQEFEEA